MSPMKRWILDVEQKHLTSCVEEIGIPEYTTVVGHVNNDRRAADCELEKLNEYQNASRAFRAGIVRRNIANANMLLNIAPIRQEIRVDQRVLNGLQNMLEDTLLIRRRLNEGQVGQRAARGTGCAHYMYYEPYITGEIEEPMLPINRRIRSGNPVMIQDEVVEFQFEFVAQEP
ncbi:hypothetical protein AVEN_275512-1 [Araneus ventricosus]|uniref:Uncharacterized protein n=1 Tax=Araneus ventricosus TaxID=182803 RepID=A0A4Y2QY67_ARAVE|nr:hypothetical protein AVEN_275512-1 [Araneus ventricosus]